MFLFVGVVTVIDIFWFKETLGLFRIGIASVALVDSFEDVYVLDELFDAVFVLLIKRGLLVVVKHKKWVFESNWDDFLFVAWAFSFFVRFLSKINKSIDEAYINFLELLAVIQENESVQKSNRSAHPRVQHIFDTILWPSSTKLYLPGISFEIIAHLLPC